VEILGPLSHSQVGEVFERSDIFVLPSRRINSETFGLVYAEAMAKGLVVFAPLKSGASDYIRDGKNGFLVDSKSELLSTLIDVVKNFNEYHELRLCAIRTVKEDLSVKIMVEKYLDFIYEDNRS
jgi:glycosyltransferase involved in cell wall biosynthesis